MNIKGVAGDRDERGTDVEQMQTRRPKFSEPEVVSIFEELDLDTQEKRDVALRQEIVRKSADNQKVRYITRLSNSTKAAPTA